MNTQKYRAVSSLVKSKYFCALRLHLKAGECFCFILVNTFILILFLVIVFKSSLQTKTSISLRQLEYNLSHLLSNVALSRLS